MIESERHIDQNCLEIKHTIEPELLVLVGPVFGKGKKQFSGS